VGSTNLDYRSFRLNDELNVVAYDAGFGAQLEKVFREDLRYARKLDLEAWRDRGVKGRIMEFMALPFESAL